MTSIVLWITIGTIGFIPVATWFDVQLFRHKETRGMVEITDPNPWKIFSLKNLLEAGLFLCGLWLGVSMK